MNDCRECTLPKNSEVKILIVDDDPIVLEVMKSIIASYGFPLATAENGQQAIARLQSDRFAIVLTDINMPVMDGMELLKYVKSHYPEIGVIVVTGLSEEYSYIDVINAGAIDYMTKPFDGSELLARLCRVIREQALVRELEKRSTCDSLTNLYNRRYFDTKIMDEVHRAVRQDYKIFLSFIDVDRFKGYNDTFGHQAGDNLLSALGHILRNYARRGVDWAFRYGGDEFAVLITQTTMEQAIKINERILSTFMEYQFGDTSLSCGLGEFIRLPGLSWQENISRFVKQVDLALYEAKHAGRGRVVCNAPALAPESPDDSPPLARG
ncbi:MAG: diguanylate cyclase [Desulfobacteraceae bacterium]|nr:diguanylate cyclase [Desulfobacteraceae bacterium]